MQIIKILLSMLIFFGFTIPCLAIPPLQVLRTCIDIKSFDDKTQITRIRGEGYADKSMLGCEDQHDRTINGHVYGTLICNNKFYFIINDKKIDPEIAENRSINPEIKPGVEFTTRSLWYNIDYDNKKYLCIRAPLSEQGIGSAYNQYYIIDNAFDNNLQPELYFYFLDKNIAPITSKTL